MAEALYRKYRPQVFSEMVGQEPIERTIKNAIEQDKVSHAYLFCGPRGTGKTTTARLLAKALLCQRGPTPEPDGTCPACLTIAQGTHPDVYELDAASRTGVENVREEIINRVAYAPTQGSSKIYIIDEVHMLSPAAFNALLKTMEEPPDHVVFILCTTDPQKVPETIHSRCQRFDFHRINPESMVARLGAVCVEEGVEFEGEALDLIAARAEGGLRNALTALEQIIAFENGRVTLAGAERLLGSADASDLTEIMTLVGQRDIAACFRWVSDYMETGADLAQFVRDMAEHVRNLYILALSGDDAVLEVSETARQSLAKETQWFGADRAARLLGVLGDLTVELKTSSNPRLSFEIALTRMVRPDSDLTLEALAERIEALEAGRGTAVAAAAVAAAPVAAAAAPAPAAVAPAPAVVAAAEPAAAAVAEPAPQMVPVPEVATEVAPIQETTAEPAPVQEVAAEVSPVPEVVAEAGSLDNPATFQRQWAAVLSEVKKLSMPHGVYFINTKATFDSASQTIVVEFPAEAAFAYPNAQSADVRNTLNAAMETVMKKVVPVTMTQLAAPAPAATAAPAPASAAAAPTPEPFVGATRSPAAAGNAPVTEPFVGATQSPASQEPAPEPRKDLSSRPAPALDLDDSQVPFVEEVPLDAYGFDEPFVVPSKVQGAHREQAAPAPAPAASPTPEPAPWEAPAPTPEPTPAPQSSGVPDDLQATLQSSFGDGVLFSEID